MKSLLTIIVISVVIYAGSNPFDLTTTISLDSIQPSNSIIIARISVDLDTLKTDKEHPNFPEEIAIHTNLFKIFANKPFKKHRSFFPISKFHQMRLNRVNQTTQMISTKLDSSSLLNLKSELLQESSSRYEFPIAIFQIKDKGLVAWVIIYQWGGNQPPVVLIKKGTPKETLKKLHDTYELGHISGKVFNKDFSEVLGSFTCG